MSPEMLCEASSVASTGMRLLASPMEPSTRMSPVAATSCPWRTATAPSSRSEPEQDTISAIRPRMSGMAFPIGPFMEEDSIAKSVFFNGIGT